MYMLCQISFSFSQGKKKKTTFVAIFYGCAIECVTKIIREREHACWCERKTSTQWFSMSGKKNDKTGN